MIEMMHELGIYVPFVFFFSILIVMLIVESVGADCQGIPGPSQKELSEYNHVIERLRNGVLPVQYARCAEINDRLNRF